MNYNHFKNERLDDQTIEIVRELSKLEVAEWSMEYDDIDDFLNYIENLQEFKIPLNLNPIKSEICLEEV